MVSGRVKGIGLSPTLRISGLAGEMRARGEDILDFSAGQPDFPSPDNVKAAGAAAIGADRTGYTANAGLQELRSAIAARYRRLHGIDYGTDQVLVSPGAKASLYFACMAMLDPGDGVIVPEPYWVTYPEQVRLAGGVPSFVRCSQQNDFKLEPDALRQAIDDRTRIVLLNYPSNPTGACYSEGELRALGEVCIERDLQILADEIYSGLLFDGRGFRSIAGLGDDLAERTVVVDGASKSFAMTGWRIGWACGPQEVIAGMARLQSHATSNATSVSQWATLAALETPADLLAGRVAEFQRRRDRIVTGLREIEGVDCTTPAGAFYVFPHVEGCFGTAPGGRVIDNAGELAEYLLEEAKVAVVPGEAFGAAGYLRLSYATSMDAIEEGIRRVRTALERVERRRR